jgi:hypothetical protein
MPTDVSLVSGVPDADSDAELILRARERVRAFWGESFSSSQMFDRPSSKWSIALKRDTGSARMLLDRYSCVLS